MSIVLIGYRGSGKTTIGRILAQRLGLAFVDSDALIVEGAGMSILEIFEEYGAARFRELEEKMVAVALGLQDRVIALGGGSLEREANRTALAVSGHRVVYLQCEAEELHRRISADPKSAAARPGLTSLDALAEVRHLLTRREPIYRQAMHVPLDVTKLSPDQAAQRIVAWLANAP